MERYSWQCQTIKGGVGWGWPAAPRGCRYIDLILQHSAALEDEAMADGDRGLSSIVRKILGDHAAKRNAERASAAANQ